MPSVETLADGGIARVDPAESADSREFVVILCSKQYVLFDFGVALLCRNFCRWRNSEGRSRRVG